MNREVHVRIREHVGVRFPRVTRLFVTIGGRRHYLWRAVDQDGDMLDILVQKHRDKRAAKRFFRKLLKGLRYAPRRIVTDKLRSYGAARKEVLPDVIHDNDKWQNNRAKVSHETTRQRERQMRRFKSIRHAQRFVSAHGSINNLFPLRTSFNESGTLSPVS